MKYKDKLIDTSTIILLVAAIIIGALILILIFWNNHLLNNKSVEGSKASEIKINKKANIDEIITKIKEKHPSIVYESNENRKYKSLVYTEKPVLDPDVKDILETEERYNSIIINIETGEELTFLDMLKKDKLDTFLAKEKELLCLKYPEFIVKGIENSEGTKGYYVTEHEVIIYYYDYSYDYRMKEDITLKIDFNEIKDLLNYKPELNKTYENENGFNYTNNKKTIALTFDDGPSSYYNPLILEELRKNKAHATFFMLGQMMNSCKSCVLETYKSGNEIGSHTYDHMNIKRGNIDKVNESLTKTDNLYNSITGDHIKLLRPPYGSYSKENLNNINNYFILWNLDTEDWRYRNVKHIVEYIEENIHDGAIILMHELYDSSYEALKIILPWAYANGYQVVSVSELAKIKGKTLEYGKAYLSLR